MHFAKHDLLIYYLFHFRGAPLDANGKPGRHVTITVRETKTERIRGSPSPQLKNQSLSKLIFH
jgi:hypothetical protein